MAVDMFLKVDGIKGETRDKAKAGEIDVLAWSWGVSNSGNAQLGGGMGAGKANCQDISVTKYLDDSSPALQLACIKGTHIKEAILTVRKAGDKPLEYLKITMSDVFVSSCSTGGSGGEDRLTENVSLNFAKMKFEHQKQKADGTGEKGGQWEYSFAENA
ncbi:Hcp family type VI secretion system effector [Panacagrimonas sp.]|uniref:Hcp family type VI secretion system effector n=1 Tax=Panacagrimonas sp. TaxID=2480088 RepID=UPI003B522C86